MGQTLGLLPTGRTGGMPRCQGWQTEGQGMAHVLDGEFQLEHYPSPGREFRYEDLIFTLAANRRPGLDSRLRSGMLGFSVKSSQS